LITEGLHSELRGTPVHVTVVFPGGIGTNIAGNSGVQMNIPAEAQQKARVTSPHDAACQILDGMERNAYRVLVGNDAKFLDLFYRVAPAQAAAFIAKQMRKLLAI
jgi:short-subunit dehydrogenase